MMKCLECEREFLANRDWQVFCCTDHRQRWHRRQRKAAAVEVAEDRLADGYTNGHAPREKVDLVAFLKLAPTKVLPRRRINLTKQGEAMSK